MKRAWYLGITPDQIAPRCVLVGDPGRVALFADRLDGGRLVSEERGLRTVTGSFAGEPVTVAAFGMGAPIAAVVLEELAGLGARVVLRAGTAMGVGGDRALLGSFVVAHAALRGEATSATYAPPGYPAAADPLLTERVRATLVRHGAPHRLGILASYDGFYTEMLALEDTRRAGIEARLAELARLGVVGVDMETSAVLVVGALRGVRAGSLCLVSVDGPSRARLPEIERRDAELLLVEIALEAVTSVSIGSANTQSGPGDAG